MSTASHEDCVEKSLGALERATFCCGDGPVDAYFTGPRIARDVANYDAAAFVLVDPADRIASFYTLSNTSIAKQELSNKRKKNHNYPNIAAVIIGYLGVDQNFQRRGFGSKTIRLALERCLRISHDSGVNLIVVDVETKNDVAMKMYRDADFEDLVEYTSGDYHLLRMIIPMKKVAAAFGALG